MVQFLETLRIEMVEVGSVLVVDVNGAFAVSSSEFGFAIQGDGADHGAIGGVDGGGILAAAIEGEDALADGVIKDGVGIAVGLNGANGLESFEVEDRDSIGAAVAGEAAAAVGSVGDAVSALCVGDVADDGVAVCIENHRVSAAGDVDAASVAIHVDVVPTALATHGDGLADVIAGAGRRRSGSVQESYSRKDDHNSE